MMQIYEKNLIAVQKKVKLSNTGDFCVMLTLKMLIYAQVCCGFSRFASLENLLVTQPLKKNGECLTILLDTPHFF